MQVVFESMDRSGRSASTKRKDLAVIGRLAPQRDQGAITERTRACSNEVQTQTARRSVKPIDEALGVRTALMERCEELKGAGLPDDWTGDRVAAAVCHFIAHNGCMRPSEWGALGIWNGTTGTAPTTNHIDLDRMVMVVWQPPTASTCAPAWTASISAMNSATQ